MSTDSLAHFDDDRRSASDSRSSRAWTGIFSLHKEVSQTFSEQWTRVQLSLRSYLSSLIYDRIAVDDCLQEVALLAWRKGPRDKDDKAFLAWCIECAKRVGANEIRRKSRSRLHALPPDLIADLASSIAEAELRDTQDAATRLVALGACLEKLAPPHRRLLEIRYALKKPEDLKKQARLVGKSMPAIYKRLERLRAVLRDCVLKALASRE